jgi:hypothetical protein
MRFSSTITAPEQDNMAKRARVITDKERRAAADFALWQKEARLRMGWLMQELSSKIDYAASTVRLYDADSAAGMDHEGRYRRPSEKYVEAVATATGADLSAGLIAARLLLAEGESSQHAARAVAGDLRRLLAKVEGKLPEMTRDLPEDAAEIVDWYEGTPAGPLRESIRDFARRMYELGQQDYSRRTDIVGKKAEDNAD